MSTVAQAATPAAAPNPLAAPWETGRERLPLPLVLARRWLVWRSIPAGAAAKPRKVPYYVSGVQRGQTDTPKDVASLATYDAALDVLCEGDYDGLGFALGPDGSGNCWQGIDVDNVPAAKLQGVMGQLPGYVELSPSGNGCHSIGYGRPFSSLGSNGSNVEAYASGRFFTFTGEQGRGEPVCIADFVEGPVARHHGSVTPSSVSSSSSVAVDPATVTELRSALSHMRADSYDLWIKMGLALSELGDLGRGLWMTWSEVAPQI